MAEKKHLIMKVEANIIINFPSASKGKSKFELATEAEFALNTIGTMITDRGESFSPRFGFERIVKMEGDTHG